MKTIIALWLTMLHGWDVLLKSSTKLPSAAIYLVNLPTTGKTELINLSIADIYIYIYLIDC